MVRLKEEDITGDIEYIRSSTHSDISMEDIRAITFAKDNHLRMEDLQSLYEITKAYAPQTQIRTPVNKKQKRAKAKAERLRKKKNRKK